MNFDPTMEPECTICDLHGHLCRYCGDELRHDGKRPNGEAHDDCADAYIWDQEDQFIFEPEDDA